MNLAAEIAVVVIVIVPLAVVIYVFVWAARKDGVEDRALQRRLWIRRTGSKTYDIMFRPTGNGEFRITSEDGLRAFLWGATVPVERIEEAVTALRSDPEYEIPNITLTLERMRKLGL